MYIFVYEYIHLHFHLHLHLQIAIVIYLLYLKLGISAVIGAIVCILIMTPLQFLIGKAMSNNGHLIAVSMMASMGEIFRVCVSLAVVALNAISN